MKGFRKIFREESPFAETITVLENEHSIFTLFDLLKLVKRTLKRIHRLKYQFHL